MKTTQNERVLRHLKDYGTITTCEAIEEYGITRLSARIKDLKDTGNKIDSEWLSSENRYGEKVSYKKYILEG